MAEPLRVRWSPRARRARLSLDETGTAQVVLPLGASPALAVELAGRHAAWIAHHRRRLAADARQLAARPALGAGRTLTLRGTEHRVIAQPAAARRRPAVRLEPSPASEIVVEGVDSSPGSVAQALERWLRRQARIDIAAAVARRAAEMGVVPGSLRVGDQRTRWGSASGRGTLSFSWRLVLCPPDVLDYVVVHELAHLRWRGHGPRFWALVVRHVPHADGHRRWLRQNGRLLRRALD